MKIIVIGAGIGGLALACGLRNHGLQVEVHERDTDLSRTGGYHLHLNPTARSALRTLLRPEEVERLYASAASGPHGGGVAFRDHRGRLLHLDHSTDDPGSIDIDRVTLRLLLAEAAGDAVRTGRTFVGYDVGPAGVTARFADGTDVTGDVLVGADGVGSIVATTLAGGPTSRPLGLLGLCGRTRRADLPAELAEQLGRRSSLAVGPGGTGLYIGYHDPVGQAAVAGDALSTIRTTEPSYIWGAMIIESAATVGLRGLMGATLRDAWSSRFAALGWSGRLLAVLGRSDPRDIAAFRFHAGDLAAGLAPWPSGRVTALGDAVHVMPPTAGMGAATAIRDAAGLTERLVAAERGETTVPVAVHDYEAAMRPYAAEAITASLRTVGWIRSTASPAGSALARIGLPAAALVHRLRAPRRPVDVLAP